MKYLMRYDTSNVLPIKINFNRALMCLDCETVFTSKDDKRDNATTCPTCCSHTVHYISKFLNRKG